MAAPKEFSGGDFLNKAIDRILPTNYGDSEKATLEAVPVRLGFGIKAATVIYFAFAITLSFYHIQTIDRPFWIERDEFYHAVIEGDFKSPYQYRILSPWLAEIPAKVVEKMLGLARGKQSAMAREAFYLFQRLVATFLLLVVFHLYLKTWFSSEIAFGGTTVLAGLHVLTYRSYFFRPDSPLNLLFLTVGPRRI